MKKARSESGLPAKYLDLHVMVKNVPPFPTNIAKLHPNSNRDLEIEEKSTWEICGNTAAPVRAQCIPFRIGRKLLRKVEFFEDGPFNDSPGGHGNISQC